MNNIIDLTDFYVVESDDGETYVIIKKDFDKVEDAVDLENKIKSSIIEQTENGIFKKCEQTNTLPFGYLPLIKVKAEDYWQAYDIDGELIDEEYSKPDIKEQLVSIYEISVLAGVFRRNPSYPGSLQIKMTIGIPLDEYEESKNSKTTITTVY